MGDAPDRIDLPGGWHLARCTDAASPRFGEWFLSDPEGLWVAHFWDGAGTGRDDAVAFARSLGVQVETVDA